MDEVMGIARVMQKECNICYTVSVCKLEGTATVTDLLKVLLGNRPVNIYHSNECATIGRTLLGNAWVDTPNNNI
jgi:hypothetical protein